MVGSTDVINAKVEAGTKSFHVFQQTLEELIESLKHQHASMIDMNNNRLKVSTSEYIRVY